LLVAVERLVKGDVLVVSGVEEVCDRDGMDSDAEKRSVSN
jgi:hypothetical protein